MGRYHMAGARPFKPVTALANWYPARLVRGHYIMTHDRTEESDGHSLKCVGKEKLTSRTTEEHALDVSNATNLNRSSEL